MSEDRETLTHETPSPEQRVGAWRWVESIVLQFPIRVALGGLFAFAAFNKLGAVQSFAEAIKGFKVVDAEAHGSLIVTAAFVVPWIEMIAGVLLVLGLWTRAAAAVLGLLTLGFIGALLHVITSDIHASCSCFGDLNPLCPDVIGWCQVLRNLVLLVPAVYLVVRRGGVLSLDALCGARGGVDRGS